MSKFIEAMKDATNFGYTENHAIKHLTTKSDLLDMFAMGAAMRNRSDEDIILMWRKAFAENPRYALKCLFYIRDVRGGQGERRFFRVCMKDLATHDTEAARRNLVYVSEYGRWDDLYTFVGTPLEKDALQVIKNQLELDVACKTPSLLAKWLKSENTSSAESRKLGNITRQFLGMTHKQYRKTLAVLRTRINVLEKLMSENRWSEIEYDKIPSKAGLKYKNAFARRDIERVKAGVQTYEQFAKDEAKTVNAGALYPYEIIKKATDHMGYWGDNNISDVDRAIIEKYWNNQIDVLNGEPCKMICVCDTSGSMRGTPLDVAIGLSMYCAERIGGPFKNHYISFSSRPQLIKIEGVDFVDKVERIYRTNLCENTNIKATFDMLKKAALDVKPEDRPDTVCIISDMQIDSMSVGRWNSDTTMTEMELIRQEWAAAGLECPRLVYWNVDARNNTILDAGPNVSFVSGFSPTTFKQVVTGVTAWDLMIQTICSKRYEAIV